jgi:SAM-dependent methyltransferase
MLNHSTIAHRTATMTPRWILALLVLALAACAHNPHEPYQPIRAQHGKDVMWIPTSDPLISDMLQMAQVNSDDLVYDLGAGDGRIAIAVAQQRGARAVGIEYNPDLAEFARENVKKAGVQDKVTIITGDIFVEDFSNASVLTLYLLESLNIRLKPQILSMKPGTRVVSNSFGMGAWIPDDAVEASNGAIGLFWIVPAAVNGNWQADLPGLPKGTLVVTQKYQFFDARLDLPDGKRIRDIEGKLRGNVITLTYRDTQGQRQSVTAVVNGEQWLEPEVSQAAPRVIATRVNP